MYERSPGASIAVGLIWVVCGAINGFNLGRMITESSDKSAANDRVEAVQKYNAELQRQLVANQAGPVVRLMLDDGAQSFSFDTTAQNGQAETCRGAYQVKDDTALATGKIACTVTSSIGK